ncbi:hypothetical protein LTS18_002624 [Coniosporium uncinatum]|uniref:Uncharacterized protein n=1 Tax=Coniosporium uncinatum TaxID=93489 RepID=A0ACC3DC42_9PEZI|nr:hypothetical protein LTS18_002624 [Coniosporium uncinatum]
MPNSTLSRYPPDAKVDIAASIIECLGLSDVIGVLPRSQREKLLHEIAGRAVSHFEEFPTLSRQPVKPKMVSIYQGPSPNLSAMPAEIKNMIGEELVGDSASLASLRRMCRSLTIAATEPFFRVVDLTDEPQLMAFHYCIAAYEQGRYGLLVKELTMCYHRDDILPWYLDKATHKLATHAPTSDDPFEELARRASYAVNLFGMIRAINWYFDPLLDLFPFLLLRITIYMSTTTRKSWSPDELNETFPKQHWYSSLCSTPVKAANETLDQFDIHRLYPRSQSLGSNLFVISDPKLEELVLHCDQSPVFGSFYLIDGLKTLRYHGQETFVHEESAHVHYEWPKVYSQLTPFASMTTVELTNFLTTRREVTHILPL